MSESSENPIAYINTKWKDIYDVLCKGTDSIFDEAGSLFTLCAAIGHLLNDTPAKFENQQKHPTFKWATLSGKEDLTILSAIAWDASNGDLTVLEDRKKIIGIAMEYAEVGMKYLYENFFKDFMIDNQLQNPEKLNIEYNLAQIIEGLRRQKSITENL